MERKTLADNMREITRLKKSERYNEFVNYHPKTTNAIISKITSYAELGYYKCVLANSDFTKEISEDIINHIDETISFIRECGFVIDEYTCNGDFMIQVNWRITL